MNTKTIRTMVSITTLAGILAACGGVTNPDFSDPVKTNSGSAGDLDLRKYVALGDSLTAGFADESLYTNGQIDSFANILAQQFKKVGGGDFTQPLVNSDLGGLNLTNPATMVTSQIAPTRRVLRITASGTVPVNQPGTVTINVGQDHQDATNIRPNNMGIPGARSFHLVASGYGDPAGIGTTANPYYARFTSPATNAETVLAGAAMQVPSFFTLWIGNNDILGYATNGGVGADATTTPAYGLGSNDITNPCTDALPACAFAGSYQAVVNTLTANPINAKGVLINLASTTSIPFFTTVAFNALPLDATQAAQANGAYTSYNGGLDLVKANATGTAEQIAAINAEADRRKINFTAGQNALVIEDDSLTAFPGLAKWRQATAEDFILLPVGLKLRAMETREIIPGNPATTTIIGIAPLTDDEVLTQFEAGQVEAARQAYNAIIKSFADNNDNLMYVDVASVLADVADADGFDYGTGTVRSTFGTGGAFSLDGVHPTARGYSIAANVIIDAINSGFNASIPKVDPNDYSTTFFEFPAGFDFSQ